jgi:hypothetical protein
MVNAYTEARGHILEKKIGIDNSEGVAHFWSRYYKELPFLVQIRYLQQHMIIDSMPKDVEWKRLQWLYQHIDNSELSRTLTLWRLNKWSGWDSNDTIDQSEKVIQSIFSRIDPAELSKVDAESMNSTVI